MTKKSFLSSVPATLALSLCAAVVLGGCAHPERDGYTQQQSNVPSPLTDLDNGEGTAAANAAQTAVDQQAIDAVNAMGAYLRTLRQFEVNADTSTDVVLDNGQNAALLRHTVLKVKRPDRLRAEITGNGNVRGLVYDGHAFMTFKAGAKQTELKPAAARLSFDEAQ